MVRSGGVFPVLPFFLPSLCFAWVNSARNGPGFSAESEEENTGCYAESGRSDATERVPMGLEYDMAEFRSI